MDFSIGELSRRTAVKAPTIRYYEQIGLLPVPAAHRRAAETVRESRRFKAGFYQALPRARL